MAKPNKWMSIEELTKKLEQKAGLTPKPPREQLEDLLKKI